MKAKSILLIIIGALLGTWLLGAIIGASLRGKFNVEDWLWPLYRFKILKRN